MNFNFFLISFVAIFLSAYAKSAEFSRSYGPFPYEINGILVGEYYEYDNKDRRYNFYRDQDGNTALHQAIVLSHVPFINSLLESVACLPLLMSVNKHGAKPVDMCSCPIIRAHLHVITHDRLILEKTRTVWRLLPKTRVTEINNILSLKEYISSLRDYQMPILLILNFDYKANASHNRRADFLVNFYFQHIETVVSDACPNPVQRFEALNKSSTGTGFYGKKTPLHDSFNLGESHFDIYSNDKFCCAKKNTELSYDRPIIAAYYLFGKKINNFGTIIFVTDNLLNTYRFNDDALLLGLAEESIKPFLLENN